MNHRRRPYLAQPRGVSNMLKCAGGSTGQRQSPGTRLLILKSTQSTCGGTSSKLTGLTARAMGFYNRRSGL